MVVGSFTDEAVYPFPAAKLWKACLDGHNLLPKIVSEFISSVEVLKGNGGVGTVRKTNFTEAVKEFTFTKDHVDVADEANYEYKYTVTEGGLCGLLVKWYSFDMKIEPTGDRNCVTKLKVEYDSLGDSLLTDDQIAQVKAGNQAMVKAFQEYLQANPDAYV